MSQFKKPKGLINRTQSPNQPNARQSVPKIPSTHISNQSQNYSAELKRANEKNQNLLASLLNEDLFKETETGPKESDPTVLKEKGQEVEEVPKIEALMPNENEKQEVSPVQINTGTDQQRKSASSEIAKNNSLVSNYLRSDIASKLGRESKRLSARTDTEPKKSVFLVAKEEADKTGPLKMADIKAKAEDVPGPIVGPQDGKVIRPSIAPIPVVKQPGFYEKNLEQVLLLVSLKKIAGRLQTENNVLKAKSSEGDDRENAFLTRIKRLENTLEDLRLRQKLSAKNPSDFLKFDLEELEARLKSIDQNLERATTDNVQEKFLEDVMEKNKEYLERTQANDEALKSLKDNVGRLKTTLLSMNNI